MNFNLQNNLYSDEKVLDGRVAIVMPGCFILVGNFEENKLQKDYHMFDLNSESFQGHYRQRPDFLLKSSSVMNSYYMSDASIVQSAAMLIEKHLDKDTCQKFINWFHDPEVYFFRNFAEEKKDNELASKEFIKHEQELEKSQEFTEWKKKLFWLKTGRKFLIR